MKITEVKFYFAYQWLFSRMLDISFSQFIINLINLFQTGHYRQEKFLKLVGKDPSPYLPQKVTDCRECVIKKFD